MKAAWPLWVMVSYQNLEGFVVELRPVEFRVCLEHVC